MICSTWNNLVLSSQKHKQNIDVAWRNAGDTAGLRQGFRINFDKLLTGFRRKGIQRVVVELAFDADRLQSVDLISNHALSVDVPLILDQHFGCFDDFFLAVGNLVEQCLECRDLFSNAFNGNLRTDDQINQLASMRKGSGS